jgi:hypothetical protein
MLSMNALSALFHAADLGHKVIFVKPNGRKTTVTDRALRYRANSSAPDISRCYWCGRAKNPNGRKLDVAHINGHEEDNSPRNLGWSCRSCNVQTGRVLAANGLGRKTRQYNPGRPKKREAFDPTNKGAQTLGAWLNAIQSMKGEPGGDMSVAAAVEMVQATSPARRSRFANEIWKKRRAAGTDRSVPF